MTPSLEVKRKFIKSLKGKGFKVKTDTGWSPIKYCHKTVDYEVWQLKTTRHSIKCADTHIVFYSNINNEVLDEVYVKDLVAGDLIATIDGYDTVVSVTNLGFDSHMYDLELDDKNHRYYSSDILSHNSATTRAYILWYSLFNADKVVAILANKLNLAQEQLQQLRDSYINLPYWMQPGVKQWNKRGIQFSHGTRVICAATSPDGIRGMSINLLYLDEFAFVKPHIADEFMASVFPTISSGKTTKVVITSCVTKDTFVFTDKGIQQVADFIDESRGYGGYEVPDYKVMGMKDDMNTGALMHNEGKVETRKIHTKYSDIECSLEHKFWAFKDGEYKWVKSKDLSEGDMVSVKYGMNCWGNDDIDFVPSLKKHKNINYFGPQNRITADIAYLIGLYISEGNISNDPTRARLDITCGDDISTTIKTLGLRYYLKPDGLHYQISSRQLVEFFEYLGFDINRRAPQKIIPKRLMQMSKEATAAMLQGIFDGDGYTSKDRYRVGISLSSKELIKQIRMLLLNFGILSTYSEILTKPTKLVKVTSMCYRLEVTQWDSVEKYFNEIGFRFGRKQNIIESFNKPKRLGDKEDYIPESALGLRALKKEHKLDHTVISFAGEKKSKKHYSRAKMLKMKDHISKSIDVDGTFLDNVREDLIWVPIKSIESGEEYVFDFSLPNDPNDEYEWCHSVVYNGIVAHNTPNGMNHFFTMWENANDDPEHSNGYVRSEIAWNAVPGRDEAWARDERKKIGEIRFNQEYKCEFLGSVSTLIDHHFLKTISYKRPLNIPKLPEYIRIYELPRKVQELEAKEWEYTASLDSGYGVHKDSSVLQIFLTKSNINTHQVAVISSNSMEIEEFCRKCYVILQKYHLPPLIVEQNGPGIAALKFFHSTVEYENLLHFDPRGNKMGLWATEKLKQNACILFKTYIQRKFMKLYDKQTINELYSFGQVTQNKWGALGGNHDDYITAAYWIPYYLQSPLYYGNIVEVNIKSFAEDEIILSTDEEKQLEEKTMNMMKDYEYHREELEKGAEYLDEYTNDTDDNDDEEQTGLFFKR